MLADRGGADHAYEGLSEGLCEIDFRRSGTGRYCVDAVRSESASSGTALRKIQKFRTLRVDQGRWRIAIRDLGNKNYKLVDADRHDRIDRRYSD